ALFAALDGGPLRNQAAQLWKKQDSISAYASINKSTEQQTVVDGQADVTSVNMLTGDRMLVQLFAPDEKCHIPRRQFDLPKEAVDGLRRALNKDKIRLQYTADVMAEIINNRRFPPSDEVVNEASEKIMQRMESTTIGDEDENLDEQSRWTQIQLTVENSFKKVHFNWKPLKIASDDAALNYALARLAPNYAEVARVLEELEGVDGGEWTSESVLDFGAGIGGAFWALN
ncbi:hypothetical protein PMAYCL1PPCAC_21902, partial [Pristionchus mayeri]